MCCGESQERGAADIGSFGMVRLVSQAGISGIFNGLKLASVSVDSLRVVLDPVSGRL